MVRTPSFDKNGIKKGAWSPEEDSKLEAYITRFGHWNWRELPKFAGLQRCGKSCRLRWMNYLRADVRRGSYTKEEEDLIMELRQKHGNKWSMIAGRLSGRTDNEIKNHWHTHLKKRCGSSSDKSHVSSSAMDSTASRGGAASLLPPNQTVADEECFRNIPILESSSVSPARHVLSSASAVSVSSSTSSGGREIIWEDMIISDCFFSGPEFTSLGDLLEPTTTNYGSSTSMDAELTMEAGLQGDDDFWTMPFSVEDMMSSYDTSNGGRGGIWEDMIMSDCFTSLGDLIEPTTTTTNYGSSTSMDAELTMVAGLQGDDDFWTMPFSVEDMMSSYDTSSFCAHINYTNLPETDHQLFLSSYNTYDQSIDQLIHNLNIP